MADSGRAGVESYHVAYYESNPGFLEALEESLRMEHRLCSNQSGVIVSIDLVTNFDSSIFQAKTSDVQTSSKSIIWP